MDASTEADQGRALISRRPAASLWRSLVGGAPRSMASGLISGCVVAAGAAPFAGWRAPTLWLVVNSALVLGSHAYAAGATRRGRDAARAFNPFTWLISATYSAAALYLVWFFDGVAQTLGVTLFGVVMFQILARDYEAPRRLAANLAAPIFAVAMVQVYASLLLAQHAEPWKIITLLASPMVAFRAFRATQINLGDARKQAREAVKQLSESEARYRLLAERSPDIIIRYDIAGVIEYISPAATNRPRSSAATSRSCLIRLNGQETRSSWPTSPQGGRRPTAPTMSGARRPQMGPRLRWKAPGPSFMTTTAASSGPWRRCAM